MPRNGKAILYIDFGDGAAMTNLERRLKHLEGRFSVVSKRVEHVIKFIDSDGALAGTLTVVHGDPGVQRWWYAAGQEPEAKLTDAQVSADALR